MCLRANGRLGGLRFGKRFEVRKVVQGLDALQATQITKRDGIYGKTLICRKAKSRLELSCVVVQRFRDGFTNEIQSMLRRFLTSENLSPVELSFFSGVLKMMSIYEYR